MNRLAVVGSSVGGGVAHSTASRIPWQKRIVGSAIQSGGGGGMLRYGLKKKMLKNQRGGGTWRYFKRTGDMLTGRRKPQRGGFFRALERGMFGVKRTKGKKTTQKGAGFGSWIERNMLGVKRTKRKTKRPQVTHNQKGGVLGLDKFASYYNSKSKKEQGQMDAWAAKNL
jgi:hypothetical protein